jgi:methyl-accepting chemotaxis protein
MDENQLKVEGLLERIGTLTRNYENQIADLRVQFTLVSQKAEEFAGTVNDLRSQLEEANRGVVDVQEEAEEAIAEYAEPTEKAK